MANDWCALCKRPHAGDDPCPAVAAFVAGEVAKAVAAERERILGRFRAAGAHWVIRGHAERSDAPHRGYDAEDIGNVVYALALEIGRGDAVEPAKSAQLAYRGDRHLQAPAAAPRPNSNPGPFE